MNLDICVEKLVDHEVRRQILRKTRNRLPAFAVSGSSLLNKGLDLCSEREQIYSDVQRGMGRWGGPQEKID